MALINFAGIASGIDTSALIKATLDQTRRTRIAPLETSNTEITNTNSALEELRTKLSNLKSTVENFRTINGGPISRLATSNNESIATAVASNNAQNGSLSLNVLSLAQNATGSFNDRFSSETSVLNASINNGAAAVDRTVRVSVGTGVNQEDVNIEITNTTTAEDFVNQFNATSTKSQASLVNTGTDAAPQYAITITSNAEGTDSGTIAISVGSEITSAGGGIFGATTINQATNAQFTLSGIAGTFTRSSNTVNDVVQGLSLSLKNTGAATIKVSSDTASTASAVREFVEAFNELGSFVRENDQVTQVEEESELTNVFGPLARTQIDENAFSGIRSALSSSKSDSGSIRILADLGITTNRDGTLEFDEDVFTQALNSEATNVGKILTEVGERIGDPSTGSVSIFTRFNGIVDAAINANQGVIDQNLRQISALESQLNREEESLTLRFARLEGSIGRLQSQQSSLSALLAGLI
jgi:flagellar hook-associated protein 2